MAVIEFTEPADDVVQKNNYNANVGGNLNRRAEASAAPSTAWAVVGAFLDPQVTPEFVESNIVPDIAALGQVVAVLGDQLYGVGPTAILSTDHECRLYLTSTVGGSVAGGGEQSFSRSVRSSDNFKVAINKVWGVFILQVPDVLNTNEITALEDAVDTVTGIQKSRHVTDGAVPDRQLGDSPIWADGHMRIEPIEVT